MASVNKVILVGNLGRDPEIKFTQDGKKIVNFSMATSETWKDKNTGEKREKTEWHRVVVFNEHIADVIEKYVKKGSKIYIEGAMKTRKWTGNDGVEKYTTEVVLQNYRGELVMLDSKGNGPPPATSEAAYGSASGAAGSEPPPPPTSGDLDDEIPF